MPRTEENLRQAFAGESQANRKYLAFAEKAEKEGNKQVAGLFRAAARAETVHAHNHLRALGGVKGTADNLREALGGETYEFENMYPPMIVDAEEEGNKQAVRTFNYANAVEKIHAALYKKALDELGNNEEVDYCVCKVCGNTVEGAPPEECPICGSKKSAFEKVE